LLRRLRETGHGHIDRVEGRLDVKGIGAAVGAADLIVLALDRPNPRLAHLVNRVCLRARTPWILATIDGNRGLAGPLFVPPHTACYSDYRALVESTTPSAAMIRRYERWTRANARPLLFVGLPAYADIVAGFTSLAVVHFLARGRSFATGRQLAVDFENMRIDVEDVLKLPRCPVCGPARSSYRPPFPPEVVEEPTAERFPSARPPG
jgi:bacteriocin biosynthesis cyclodehydratase domain-containing protein